MTVTSTVGTRAITARDVMSSPAVVIPPSASLWDAARLMATSGVRHLVVCFHGRVVGVVDDRALFAQWPLGPQALRCRRLEQVVRSRTSCVLEDAELRRVAEVMMIDSADAVPIVDDTGMVLGIVTSSDLVAAVARYGVTEETP
jgi:CBS-domain-containing membrane protein